MKNIKITHLAIILLSLIVMSCNDNEDKIMVSDPIVNVRENLEQNVEISGGTGSYSYEINDTEIATAKISGQVLTITGLSTGTTYITIKDGVNTPVSITVKVLHQKIVFEITELKSKIEIGKDEYYNSIIEELQEYYPFPVGTRYELMIKSEKPNTVSPDIIKGDLLIYLGTQEDIFYGTFELYGDQLIMSYSSKTDKYIIDTSNGNWFISENLTELYRIKYPEADIKYIYNEQILKILSGKF